MNAVPAQSETLTVGAAARRLGIAAPTLRSWERRYGLSPSTRSTGGHRRYSPEDLARLRAMVRMVDQGVPTAEAAASVRDRIHPAQSPSVTSATSVAEGTRDALRGLARTRPSYQLVIGGPGWQTLEKPDSWVNSLADAVTSLVSAVRP